MTNVAEESYGNVRTVKAFSNEREEILKFEAFNNEITTSLKLKPSGVVSLFSLSSLCCLEQWQE